MNPELWKTERLSASVPIVVAGILNSRHGCFSPGGDRNLSRFVARACMRNVILKGHAIDFWAVAYGRHVDGSGTHDRSVRLSLPEEIYQAALDHCHAHGYDPDFFFTSAVTKHLLGKLLPCQLFERLYQSLLDESSEAVFGLGSLSDGVGGDEKRTPAGASRRA